MVEKRYSLMYEEKHKGVGLRRFRWDDWENWIRGNTNRE